MNSLTATLDELHLSTEKSITKQLDVDEKIANSCMVHKFNKRMKRQERSLMITNKAVYNLSKTTIKRKIPVTKIVGITVSKMSSEFVLHCPEEYDYRYSSAERRDVILEMVTRAYINMTGNKKGLAFYYKEEINLTNWTTTKADKKKAISKIPKDVPTFLNEESFKKKQRRLG